MSKCKPSSGGKLELLSTKGVRMNDTETTEGKRVVQIEIPYELLRDDLDVQKVFQDIVYIRQENIEKV